MSQTSYSFYQSVPYAGVIADGSPRDVRSYINAEASAAMPFGIAVCQGATDNACLLMVDANSKILGLTIHTHAVDPNTLPTSPAGAGVKIKGTASVMRRGSMWALVDATVAPQGDVYARYTTTTAPKDQLGVLGPSGDTSTALQITGAKFLTTAAAGAVAQVAINMP